MGTCAKASLGWGYPTCPLRRPKHNPPPPGAAGRGLYTHREQLSCTLGLTASVTLGAATPHDESVGTEAWREGMVHHAALTARAATVGLARRPDGATSCADVAVDPVFNRASVPPPWMSTWLSTWHGPR
ncbi:hypothetical protein BHE74_00035527 [Ensete ventricosum]|nr:hypothetical protein GW17_00010494 [Ensete ventricosum]RWW57667.1 hypothetical protein BHE74_00035527 [Ensete ventricosum]RZR86664.1 hypothetical protein BHM03_00013909 [Ensete ventricosum]